MNPLVLLLVIKCASPAELDALIEPFRHFKRQGFAMLNATVESKTNLDLLRSRGKLQPFVKTQFPCKLKGRSPRIPESVHELRPGDIDVVGGIGDSLTAGVGLMATKALYVPLEHRGYAPTAGGKGSWRRYLTLPNILKMFNPNLTGYATQTSLTIHPESRLNLGETGAVSEDMPYMATVLVERAKELPGIDMDRQWKMITFMVGPNDFCSHVCFEDDSADVLQRHENDLVEVLRTLKSHLPRTIVNLIPPPNLKILTEFTNKSFGCETSHLLECPCLFGPVSQNRQKSYIELMERWQNLDMEVANREEFDSENFTVVVQPFAVNFYIPEKFGTDYSYLSEDCFHMSQKGNARIANSLWNNLMEPVGLKSTKPVDFFTIKCPTEQHPYIFTRRNSK